MTRPADKGLNGAPANEPLGRTAWWVLAALTAHVAEELPRFPDWATRHFGTTSTAYFVLSHVPLMGAVLWIVSRAARPEAGAVSTWWLWMVQSALAVNAVFHVAATLWFREYSPGVVTGLVLYLPVTLFLLRPVARRLGPLRTAIASCAGALVSLLLVASLWLEITFV